MSQETAQTEELRRSLEAAKAELKRLLGGCGRQKDVEALVEQCGTSPAINGAEGAAAKSPQSSQRGYLLILSLSFTEEVKRNLLLAFKINLTLTAANADGYLNRCPSSFNPVM